MNILSFLKPKNEVVYVYDDESAEMAIKIMQHCRFTSIPILSRNGEYVGTLSEGDLLYALYEVGKESLNQIKVSNIKRNRDYESVNIGGTILSLVNKASNENFVPVVDDSRQFIGIVTRKTLLNYFFEHNFMVL